MQKEQCFSLGKITKLHGYKGAVVLHIDSSTPQYFKELESVFLEINQELVPFFLDKPGKLNGKKMIVEFEDIKPDEAPRLVGCSAYLPQELLPEPEEGEFYDKAIIGYTAIDVSNKAPIGKVIDIIENTAQSIFVLGDGEKEYLVPVVEAFIKDIDHKQKMLYLQVPEGLLDL